MKQLLAPFFSSPLRRNLSATAGGSALNAGLALLSYPLFLHYLGYGNYGVWLTLSGLAIATTLGSVGLAPALTKFIAGQREEKEACESLLASALVFTLLSTGCIAAMLIFARDWLARAIGFEGELLTLALSLLPPLALLSVVRLLSQLLQAALVGLGRADSQAWILSWGRLSFLLASWLCLTQGLASFSLVWGLLFSLLLEVALACFWLKSTHKLHPLRLRLVRREPTYRLLRFGRHVAGASLMQVGLHPLNKLLLARFGAPEAVPLFEIAWSGSLQIRSLLASALSALLPDFSRALSQGQEERARVLLKKAYGLLAASFALFVLAFALLPWFLPFWLQASYLPAQLPITRVMLLGAYASLLGVPAYFYLLGANRPAVAFLSQAIQSGANFLIALALLLLARLTPLSLAFCVSSAMALSTLYLLQQTLRRSQPQR